MAYVETKLRQAVSIDRIITIHYFEYMNDFVFRGESHNFWEALYVDKGEVEVQAGASVYPLKRGDIIFHMPMEFHAVKAAEHTAPNLVVFSFVCKSPAMHFFERRIFSLRPETRAILSNVIAEARLAFSSPLNIPSVEQVKRRENAVFGSEQLIKINLEALLIFLVREGAPSPGISRTGNRPGRQNAPSDVADRIENYLKLHLCDRLNITTICSEMLISRSSLEDLFHEREHCGVMEYFSRLKIERAKELMRTGSMNFSEISEYLSFPSPSYFSQKFRGVIGMTPSEYIRSVKGLLPGHREKP